MNKIIYKHKSGIKVIKDGNVFIQIEDKKTNNFYPKEVIENSNEWSLIEPEEILFELCFESDEIYFKDVITNKIFKIGDEVELKPNISYPNCGCKKLKIKSFYISGNGHTTKFFKYIYATTTCKNNTEHSPHLNDLI